MIKLSDIPSSKATVIMFICNHCPFVIHLHDGLKSLINNYQNKKINFIAISANDVNNYPEDSPEKMKLLFSKLGFTFPYLYDESQSIAKAYDAACTPDFYIFNNALELAYRGQFDSSRPGNNIPVTGKNLRSALDDLLANNPVSTEQSPSLGCNIKWKE